MAWVKRIYLYVVSLIALVILVVAAITLINMALKAWVFTKADQNYYNAPQITCAPVPTGNGTQMPPVACSDPAYLAAQEKQQREAQSAQRQSDAAHAIAMIIVATPVFLYHWRLARKEA